jgi:hypothetical protein
VRCGLGYSAGGGALGDVPRLMAGCPFWLSQAPARRYPPVATGGPARSARPDVAGSIVTGPVVTGPVVTGPVVTNLVVGPAGTRRPRWVRAGGPPSQRDRLVRLRQVGRLGRLDRVEGLAVGRWLAGRGCPALPVAIRRLPRLPPLTATARRGTTRRTWCRRHGPADLAHLVGWAMAVRPARPVRSGQVRPGRGPTTPVLPSRVLTGRVLVVRVLVVRVLSVRVLSGRVLTGRVLTVRVLTVRVLTVRVLTGWVLTGWARAVLNTVAGDWPGWLSGPRRLRPMPRGPPSAGHRRPQRCGRHRGSSLGCRGTRLRRGTGPPRAGGTAGASRRSCTGSGLKPRPRLPRRSWRSTGWPTCHG